MHWSVDQGCTLDSMYAMHLMGMDHHFDRLIYSLTKYLTASQLSASENFLFYLLVSYKTICIYIYIYIYIYIILYICIYLSIYIYVSIYLFIYLSIIYIHTHMYIYNTRYCIGITTFFITLSFMYYNHQVNDWDYYVTSHWRRHTDVIQHPNRGISENWDHHTVNIKGSTCQIY